MVEIETLENESSVDETAAEWEKLMGDDLLMKVIKSTPPRDGKDPQLVQPNDAVLIDFTGRLAESPSVKDGNSFQNAQGWFIVVGDGDVLPALELAIRFMKSGQTALVWSHSKFAFSTGTRTDGDTTVPPHANVMFEVTVTQIVQDTSRLNPYFTIQKALSRKKIANDIYTHEFCPPPKTDEDPNSEAAMARALKLYKKAASEMETLLHGTYFNNVEENHPQRHETTQVMMDSLNNIVALYLRQKEYHKAKQAAVEVLKQDSKNIKGLLRAAKASLLDPASTMEEVQAALDEAEKQITYRNPQEEKELKRLKTQFKRKQQEYKKKTKEMFADKLKTESLTKEAPESPTLSESNEASITIDDTKGRDGDTENKNEGSLLWRSQYLILFLQIIFPLVLLFIYRSMNSNNITENESVIPKDTVTPIEATSTVDPVDEGSSDTIDLDL